MAGQNIVGGRGGRRGAAYELFPPASIGAGVAFHGPGVKLAEPVSTGFFTHRRTVYKLGEPQVVNPFVSSPSPPIEVRLASIPGVADRQRRKRTVFYGAAVVGSGVTFAPVRVELAASRRGKPRSILGEPQVVNQPTVFIASPVEVHLAYSRRGKTKSRLALPIIPPLARPIKTIYWASTKTRQNAKSQRRDPFSHLSPPAVVGGGIAFSGPRIRLAPATRGKPRSILSKPAVVGAGIVFRPVQIELTYSRRGRPRSDLFAPAVIGSGIFFAPIEAHLAYSRRGRPKSELNPPAVVGATPFAPIKTTLVRIRSKPTNSLFIEPAAIGAGIIFPGPHVRLAPSTRGKAKSVLFEPAVVSTGTVSRPVQTHLAYSRRGRAKSILFKPVLPLLAPPIETRLVSNLVRVELADRRPYSRLFAPAVIGGGIAFGGPRTLLTYSRRGVPKSDLRAPAVVGAGIVFAPVKSHLAYSRRGVPKSVLFEPAVIGSGIFFAPLEIHLSPSKRGQPKSHLFQPIIPPLAPPIEEKIVVQLVRIRLERRLANSKLLPPAVVGAGITFRAIDVELAYSRRGKPIYKLVPPAVVGAGIVFRNVDVTLAPSKRGKPRSILLPPIIPPLAPPVEERIATQLVRLLSERRLSQSNLFGPALVGAGIVFEGIKQTLAPSHQIGRQRRFDSRLSPPAIVVPATQIYFGPSVHLAPSKRGKPKSTLFDPAVVGAGIAFPGPRVGLTPSRRGIPKSKLRAPLGTDFVAKPTRIDLAPSTRGKAKSRLFSPAVISTAVFSGPLTHLAPAPKQGRLPHSALGRPIVVFQLQAIGGIGAHLVRIRPVATHSILRQPAVIGSGIFFAPVSVTKALRPRIEIARLRPIYRLEPPTVVQPATLLFFGPETRLTYSKRGIPKSILRDPAVVGAGIVFNPLSTNLAYSRRGTPKSVLHPAIIPPLAPPVEERISVQIVRARLERRLAFSHLAPPAVIGAGIVFRPLDTTIVRGRAGVPKSRLRSPAVIGAGIVFRSIDVTLAPSKRGKPIYALRLPIIPPVAHPVSEEITVQLVRARYERKLAFPRLAPPAVVGAGIVFAAIKTTLAPSHQIGRQRRYDSKLSPPAVVQPQTLIFFGPKVELAPSKRGRPISHLRAPAVVGAGIVYRSVKVELTYSRRGRPKSLLRQPIIPPLARPVDITLVRIRPVAIHSKLTQFVAPAIVFRPVDVTLAPSTKLSRKPVAHLYLPNVVGAGIVFAPVAITLAPSRRLVAKSELYPPAVIQKLVAYRGILSQLAPSRRGETVTVLRAPTVVGSFSARPISISLAPSFRGKPIYFLRQPTVVAQPPFRPIQVVLAPSTRGVPSSLLKPPTVVGAGIYFRGILVRLAPPSHGKPHSALFPPAGRRGRHGCVTGFDFSPFSVGGFDQEIADVSGTDFSLGDVSGTDIGHGVVSGSDTSQTDVSGSDRRNC